MYGKNKKHPGKPKGAMARLLVLAVVCFQRLGKVSDAGSAFFRSLRNLAQVA